MRTPRCQVSPAPKCSSSGATLAGAFLLVFLVALLPGAHAATVVFKSTNLADTTPGEDLWQYQYVVSDLALNPGQGFSIFLNSASTRICRASRRL